MCQLCLGFPGSAEFTQVVVMLLKQYFAENEDCVKTLQMLGHSSWVTWMSETSWMESTVKF